MRRLLLISFGALCACRDRAPPPAAPGKPCTHDFQCAGLDNACVCKPRLGDFSCEIGKDPSFCAPRCHSDFQPELDPATDPEGAAVEQDVLERKLNESCPSGWRCGGSRFGWESAHKIRYCVPDEEIAR